MRRLYHQIYLAFVAVALLCVVVAALTAHALDWQAGQVPRPLQVFAQVVADALPPAGDPALEGALQQRADELGLQLSLWDASGRLLASAGPPLARRHGDPHRPGWFRIRGRQAAMVRLNDGRALAGALTEHAAGVRLRRHLVILAALALAVALGCWPLTRRITRRLEALQRGVEDWGAGELSARVPVCGKDEVARLAKAFNRSAERIEDLVEAQRRVLASASHELRSPLARLRMAVELLAGDDPERREQLDGAGRDIAELDELVGDLLLQSRLRAAEGEPRREPVDLLALLAAEGARTEVDVTGEPTEVQGDPALLRRLVRNLLDNARRHGGEAVEARVEPADGGGALLVVEDRGPGVPEAERERIFEPFYRPPGHHEGDDGGVGLGLALVRGIAEHHGGTARCLAREGGGSRFEVTLPDKP